MAAKVYSVPPEVGDPPEFDYKDSEGSFKREETYIAHIQAWAKKHGKGKYAGELFRYGVADGSALYVVFSLSPVGLIHVPVGDAYNISAVVARGLNAEYVRQYVDRSKKADMVFAPVKSVWGSP